MAQSRILIVEDDIAQGAALKHALEELGYSVLGPAPDCSSALELIWQEQPDLALVDTFLGADTCEVVLDECDRQQVPVLVSMAGADPLPLFCETRTRLGQPVTVETLDRAMAVP
jgi:DNA-binding response OmpR family regulator